MTMKLTTDKATYTISQSMSSKRWTLHIDGVFDGDFKTKKEALARCK